MINNDPRHLSVISSSVVSDGKQSSYPLMISFHEVTLFNSFSLWDGPSLIKKLEKKAEEVGTKLSLSPPAVSKC